MTIGVTVSPISDLMAAVSCVQEAQRELADRLFVLESLLESIEDDAETV